MNERNCSLEASEGRVFIGLEADGHHPGDAHHGGGDSKATQPSWFKPSPSTTGSRAQHIDMAVDRSKKIVLQVTVKK